MLTLRDRLGPDHGALRADVVPKLRCTKCGGRQVGIISTPGTKEYGGNPYLKRRMSGATMAARLRRGACAGRLSPEHRPAYGASRLGPQSCPAPWLFRAEMRSIPSVAATQPPIARPSRAVQPSTLVLRCAIPTPNLRILKRSGAAPTFRISAPAASFRPPIFLVRGWPWWPATAAHSELNVVALQPSVAGLNSSRRPSSSRTA